MILLMAGGGWAYFSLLSAGGGAAGAGGGVAGEGEGAAGRDGLAEVAEVEAVGFLFAGVG